jgi:hypothetical protein
MRMCLKISWLFAVILVLRASGCFAQAPVNDACSDAIDISDQAWHPGNNAGSTLACGADFRLGNCSTPQQSSNLCCGIDGIEGTVWYRFISPSSGPATLEFQNTSCNPSNFFGITTTLQGFLLIKASCAFPESDLVVTCFNPSSAANFGNGFTAAAGQEYYVQIDTKRNTFSSCGCPTNVSTCHSSCAFEIRVTFPVAAPITDFSANAKNNFVNIKWLYDWKDLYTNFYLVRKNISTKDSVVISSMPIAAYTQDNNYFTYNDYSVKNNGIYKYSLYASIDKGDLKLVGSDDISVNFAQETHLSIVPNPSSDNIKLMLTNTSGNAYPYSICNALGQTVKSGYTEQSVNTETSLNISDLSPGIYLAKVTLEDRVLQQNLIKE